MSIHMSAPDVVGAEHESGFDIVKVTSGWIAIRQRTEGHVFTFFFNAARTALASVAIAASATGRYDPAYFEEAAWRFADRMARSENLIFARQAA